MTQKRQTKTKKQIKQALTILLKDIPFEELTITAICKVAQINRSTFYLHYLDKYDMMDQLKEDTLSHIYAMITDETQDLSKEMISYILNDIYHDFDFISVMANTSYVNFSRSIREFIHSILLLVPNFDRMISQAYGDIPSHYAQTAYIASIESAMTQWIRSGGAESPDEMAEIVYQITYRPTD